MSSNCDLGSLWWKKIQEPFLSPKWNQIGSIGLGVKGEGGFRRYAYVCFSSSSFFFFFQDNKIWKRRRKTYKLWPHKICGEAYFLTPRGCSFKRIVVCLIVYQTFPCSSIHQTEKVGGGEVKKKKKKVELNVVLCGKVW